jgi:TPR repeat protein
MPTTDYDFHAHFFGDNRRLMTDAEKKRLHAAISTAAEHRDPEGMTLLGRLYYEGFTVAQNYTAARRWFERADTAGDSWGTVYLAYCYYYGRNIPVNYPRARALFAKAAKYFVQVFLRWMEPRARALFAKAAKAGNHCALYKLGDMARDGLAVPVDLPRALACYREALAKITPAVPEYPNIAARIGHLLLAGIDPDAGTADALHWLHIAQEGCCRLLMRGDPYAHLSLPQIEADLAECTALLKAAVADLPQKVRYPVKPS